MPRDIPPARLPLWLQFKSKADESLFHTIHSSQNPADYVRRLGKILREGEGPDGTGICGPGDALWSDPEAISLLLAQRVIVEFDIEAFRQFNNLRNLGRNEHGVFHPEGFDVVYKVTIPAILPSRGYVIKYLDRIEYLNTRFDTNYHVLGAIRDATDDQYSFVLSQPWLPDARCADQDEIDAYFASYGLLKYINSTFLDVDQNILVEDVDCTNVLSLDFVESNGHIKTFVYPVDIISQRISTERMVRLKSHVDKRELRQRNG